MNNNKYVPFFKDCREYRVKFETKTKAFTTLIQWQDFFVGILDTAFHLGLAQGTGNTMFTEFIQRYQSSRTLPVALDCMDEITQSQNRLNAYAIKPAEDESKLQAKATALKKGGFTCIKCKGPHACRKDVCPKYDVTLKCDECGGDHLTEMHATAMDVEQRRKARLAKQKKEESKKSGNKKIGKGYKTDAGSCDEDEDDESVNEVAPTTMTKNTALGSNCGTRSAHLMSTVETHRHRSKCWEELTSAFTFTGSKVVFIIALIF
jgi:hypothetical protein